MTTKRQARAVAGILAGKSAVRAVKEAGYCKALVNHPGRVFRGRGVRDLMTESGIELGNVFEEMYRKYKKIAKRDDIEAQGLLLKYAQFFVKVAQESEPKEKKIKKDTSFTLK